MALPGLPPPRLRQVRIPAHCLTSNNRHVRARQLWGSDVYTEDSDLVAVLMHCGYWYHSRAQRGCLLPRCWVGVCFCGCAGLRTADSNLVACCVASLAVHAAAGCAATAALQPLLTCIATLPCPQSRTRPRKWRRCGRCSSRRTLGTHTPQPPATPSAPAPGQHPLRQAMVVLLWCCWRSTGDGFVRQLPLKQQGCAGSVKLGCCSHPPCPTHCNCNHAAGLLLLRGEVLGGDAQRHERGPGAQPGGPACGSTHLHALTHGGCCNAGCCCCCCCQLPMTVCG